MFSGCGALDLAVELVTGQETAWQIEAKPEARTVLARHWPEADRSCTNVRGIGGADVASVSTVIGGFPCQDLSTAGSGEGLEGARSGLWWTMPTAIDRFDPTLVVVENVPGLLSKYRAVIDAELLDRGYSVTWVKFSAASVGAPHWRRRVLAWPTPTATNPNEHETPATFEARSRKLVAAGSRPLSEPLGYAVRREHRGDGGTGRKWGTPTATAKGCSGNDSQRTLRRHAHDDSPAAKGCTVYLDPDWQGVLMGLPIGWTRGEGPSQLEEAKRLCLAPRWPAGRGQEQHVWEPPRVSAPSRDRKRRLAMGGNGVVPAAVVAALRLALAPPPQPTLFGATP